MLLTDTEIEIAEKALAFAKNNRTRICRRLTDINMFPPEESPVSVFMSGSPGAGKTETSKELVSSLAQDQGGVLRLDPDDLRAEFEEYHGSNSYLFQKAISVLIERALDYVFRNNQSFLLDGTLSSYGVAEKNIQRSINKERAVLIIFVYQRPELAWQFVKAREKLEGRRILPEHFIDQFFGSQLVVDVLKEKFADKIQVDLLIKDNDGLTASYQSNIDRLKPCLKTHYTRDELVDIVRKL